MSKVRQGFTVTLVAAIFAVAPACGDEGGTDGTVREKNPQIFPNPVFVLFPVTRATGLIDRTITYNNGGQDPLVITSVTLADTNDSAFTVGNPTTEVLTGAAGFVGLRFAPSARGMSRAALVIESNAENAPVLELDVIGPASADPRPQEPDIIAVDDPVEVIADINQAFIRLINLGSTSLVIPPAGSSEPGVEITSDPDDVFEFAQGVEIPSGVFPAAVGPGDFYGLTLNYIGTSGTHTATVRIRSTDPDQPDLDLQIQAN